MARSEISGAPLLERRLEFERLLADLSSSFVNVPPQDVDRLIDDAQRQVCECLNIDLAAVWQWPPGNPTDLAMTHLYRPLGGPPVPEPMNGAEYFPWVLAQLQAGRTVKFTSLDELPPEAAHDRAVYEHFGVRSTLTLPLRAGGAPIHGCVGFNTTRREHAWPEDVAQRLRLVAEVFANALVRKRADRDLRDSEARLSLAADAAGVGLWTLDYDTGTYWATEQARAIFGYPPGSVVSHDLFESSVHPEDLPMVRDAVARSARTGDTLAAEYRILRPDGELRWISSRGRSEFKATGEAHRLMGVSIDITERRLNDEALHQLSQRLIRAHEDERALIARELHDDVTQRLAVLAIEVGRAAIDLPEGPQADLMTSVHDGLARLSEDVHTLAYHLHPSVLEELGLPEALRAECSRRGRQSSFEIGVDLDPSAAGLDREAALCLFRVAQEALTNVARHAAAHVVTVTLRRLDDGVVLAVRDDGVGFAPRDPGRRRRLGLASMRERIWLVKGTLDVESEPGAGTSVVAWVPDGAAPR